MPKNKFFAKFSSDEHKKAGDEIQLQILDDQGKITLLPVNSPFQMYRFQNGVPYKGNLTLSYGDILSLAGDYFAFEEPIATTNNSNEAAQRFIKGFNSLADSNQETIEKINKINKETYSSNGRLNEYAQQFMFVLTLGKQYFTNTNNNLDHFYTWSVSAYRAGHQVALAMAKEGNKLKDEGKLEEANRYLMLAYQMNAFACHYLSDSFSSGHLRELSLRSDLSKKFGVLGGILINNMHNEDNTLGVNVKNKNGDHWTAYGDDNFNKTENSANRVMHRTALQTSADEIFKTYQTGEVLQQSKVADYLPEVDDSSNKNYLHPQHAPMFKAINNKIYYRDPLTELNPNKAEYKELGFFSAMMIAIKLRLFSSSYIPTYTPTPEPQKSVNTNQLLSVTKCNRDLAVYERTLVNTQKVVSEPVPEPAISSAHSVIIHSDEETRSTFSINR